MKIKHLSTLLVTSTLAFGVTPAIAESSQPSSLSFSCQTEDGVPTTIARASDSDVLVPVFHWKNEALPQPADARQLCDSVSAKLEDYSAQGYDLSAIGFRSDEQAGLPAICAVGEDKTCNLVLFTLAPAEKPVDAANEVLTAILDKNLQTNQIKSNDRGVQSISYQVNFWSLLGFPKFIK